MLIGSLVHLFKSNQITLTKKYEHNSNNVTIKVHLQNRSYSVLSLQYHTNMLRKR